MHLRQAFNGSNLIFSKDGLLIGISTGIDYCNEHERGTNKLMNSICSKFESESESVDRLNRYNSKTIERLRVKISGGFKYTDVLESKRINKDIERILFSEEKRSDQHYGWLCYHPEIFSLEEVDNIKNSLYQSLGRKENEISSAWGEDGFLIGVKGKANTEALKGFYNAIKDEQVVFAGKWLESKGKDLRGIIMANYSMISKEDKERIINVQKDFDSKVRLYSQSEEESIILLMKEKIGHVNCYIEPVWKDSEESEVLYNLMPKGKSNLERGSYSKKSIVDWINDDCLYILKK